MRYGVLLYNDLNFFISTKKRLTLESFCIGCNGRKTRRLLCSKAVRERERERERERFMTEEIGNPFYATRSRKSTVTILSF